MINFVACEIYVDGKLKGKGLFHLIEIGKIESENLNKKVTIYSIDENGNRKNELTELENMGRDYLKYYTR